MSSRSTPRIAGDELSVRPRNYGHLQGLAARYAQTRLHGRSVVNRATGRPILLEWPQGLRQAAAPGTAPELLLSLPALPSLLAQACYLGAGEDPGRRPDVRRVHGFGARVDVTGRPIEILLVARQDRRGGLSLDRILSARPLVAPKEDGGFLPDLPGARSRALRAVLARNVEPTHRQDGGGTPGQSDNDDNSAPTDSDPAADALPPDPTQGPADTSSKPDNELNPPSDSGDRAGEGGSDAPPIPDDGLPPLPASAPSRIDPHPPWEDIDPETVFDQRNARLAELRAQGIDPRTDPVFRDLSRKLQKGQRQIDERFIVDTLPLGAPEKLLADAIEGAAPIVGRLVSKARGAASRVAEAAAARQAAREALGRGTVPPAAAAPLPEYPEGAMSLAHWLGYPNGVPTFGEPVWPLFGSEYTAARKAANAASRRYRAKHPAEVAGKVLHHLRPVKLGGPPADPTNFYLVTPEVHALLNHHWGQFLKDIGQ